MSLVCSKCMVGGHYILLVNENELICFQCCVLWQTKKIKKYNEERLKRCLYPRKKISKIKKI